MQARDTLYVAATGARSRHITQEAPMPILATHLTHPVSDRKMQVLQLLGRLGMVMSTTIHNLIFPDMHEASRNRMLADLVTRRLIWRARMPNTARDELGHPLGSAPRVYGLTDDGKAELAIHGLEPASGPFSIEQIAFRPKNAPTPPDEGTRLSNAYVSAWVGSLLDQVRRLPALVGVSSQAGYTIRDDRGQVVQRMSAVIVLRFDPQRTVFERPLWAIPWAPDIPREAQPLEVCLALEIDNGRRSLTNITDTISTYKTYSEAGVYLKLFGGNPIPVQITQPGERALQLADLWMNAWDGSPAVLSNLLKTGHETYGVLWGDYVHLRGRPAPGQSVKRGPLLGSTLGTLDQWPDRIAAWNTEMRH